MVSVMRATSESGDAPGVRVTNPAMPHISDAVEATFLNSHTRRLVGRWPREDENGADGGRAVREVFCRTKPMMLSRLFSWFPRHIVPCTSGRWRRGIFGRSRWLFHWSICDLVTIDQWNSHRLLPKIP